MKLNSLQDLLFGQLHELHNAEMQKLKVLPKLVTLALLPELRRTFREQLKQTYKHAERVEHISRKLGNKVINTKCKGMEGIIQEGKDGLQKKVEPTRRDLILIAVAQRIAHYEIAAYGTAGIYLESLGKEPLAKIIQETRDEEIRADEKLSALVEKLVYREADIRL